MGLDLPVDHYEDHIRQASSESVPGMLSCKNCLQHRDRPVMLNHGTAPPLCVSVTCIQ